MIAAILLIIILGIHYLVWRTEWYTDYVKTSSGTEPNVKQIFALILLYTIPVSTAFILVISMFLLALTLMFKVISAVVQFIF